MIGLALQVQQALGRDPHAGDLYVFRGAAIFFITMALACRSTPSDWRKDALCGRRQLTA
jgi:hypothetical protein